MNFDAPFTSLMNIWYDLQEFFTTIIEFTTNEMNFEWWNNIPEVIQNLLTALFPTLILIPEQNMSVLSFLLGSGIIIILAITFVKWVIGVIT